jgi:hypothetical protein
MVDDAHYGYDGDNKNADNYVKDNNVIDDYSDDAIGNNGATQN